MVEPLYPARLDKPLQELIMKCNTGTVDRAIRVIAGLALIALAATGTIGVWGYIGVVVLLTGVVGFCPGYALIGCNTCETKEESKK